jgi:uncharacterized membrane protein YgaE (UPF0421/DUF939 family)
MPEAYWAAIATLVVMQSSLGATLTLSIERVAATALGASVGAVEAHYFGANLIAFFVVIVLIGLLSYGFRLEKDRLSLCRRYAGDHHFDSAIKSCVDHRPSSIH